MPHQSTELPVMVDGVKHGGVVLVQRRSGPLLVSLAMRGLEWSPDAAEAAGRALIRAAERARLEARRAAA